MKTIGEMTNAELAAYVQSHLREEGIEVVLSGGADVSIHSGDNYVSIDLDLINTRFAKRRLIRETMREIGFSEAGRHFTHPEAGFLIDFPPGSLSIGNEPVKNIEERKLPTGLLRIIAEVERWSKTEGKHAESARIKNRPTRKRARQPSRHAFIPRTSWLPPPGPSRA